VSYRDVVGCGVQVTAGGKFKLYDQARLEALIAALGEAVL
jgi:hypothetical protein